MPIKPQTPAWRRTALNIFLKTACFSLGLGVIEFVWYVTCFFMQLLWYHGFAYMLLLMGIATGLFVIAFIFSDGDQKNLMLSRWFRYTKTAIAVSVLISLPLDYLWFEHVFLIYRLLHTDDVFYILFMMVTHFALTCYVFLSIPKFFMKLESNDGSGKVA